MTKTLPNLAVAVILILSVTDINAKGFGSFARGVARSASSSGDFPTKVYDEGTLTISQLRQCLESDREMTRLARKISGMEDDSRRSETELVEIQTQIVATNEYLKAQPVGSYSERVVTEHNRIVDEHNATVDTFNRKLRAYQSGIQNINSKVERNNRMASDFEKSCADKMYHEDDYNIVNLGRSSTDSYNFSAPTIDVNLLALGTPLPIAEPSAPTLIRDKRSIVEVQYMLNNLGFRPGVVDGIIGAQTKAAVAEYQRVHGMQSTGTLTQGVLSKIRESHNVFIASEYED